MARIISVNCESSDFNCRIFFSTLGVCNLSAKPVPLALFLRIKNNLIVQEAKVRNGLISFFILKNISYRHQRFLVVDSFRKQKVIQIGITAIE